MATKPKLPSGKGQSYKGEVEAPTKGNKFAKPYEDVDGGVTGMGSLKNDIGEKSGFEANTDAYIVKKGTAFGEAAKFNIMPPGMDINDQPYADIRDMPLKKITGTGYDGDGWEGARDLEEDHDSKGRLA